MAEYKSKEKSELDKSIEKFMKKTEKEEKKRTEILKCSKSELSFLFGQNLKKICKKKGITGKMAKDELDIFASDLSEYKNGKKQITLKNLEMLANRLNISPYYLLGVTDNPYPVSPILNNMICGLSLDARYTLIALYYGLEDKEDKVEIVDDETGEIDVNVLSCGEYDKNFEILSAFIADFSNFCDFFTYIKRYVEIKQEDKKTDDDLQVIKEKIQNSVFSSLDKIAIKGKENKE